MWQEFVEFNLGVSGRSRCEPHVEAINCPGTESCEFCLLDKSRRIRRLLDRLLDRVVEQLAGGVVRRGLVNDNHIRSPGANLPHKRTEDRWYQSAFRLLLPLGH